MNLYTPARRTRSSISLTPLIDVVFILLLFFMLASNHVVDNSVAVDASSAGSADSAAVLETVRLQVLADEQYRLDGESMNKSTLIERLAALHDDGGEIMLSVSVASGVRVQALLDVISLAGQTGLARVSMEPGEL